MAEFEYSSSSSTSTLDFNTPRPLHAKMLQTATSKTSKVTATCELVVDHIKALPEREKCEDEDFVLWGKKFLELKVCCGEFC
jgi:hypothetical protein